MRWRVPSEIAVTWAACSTVRLASLSYWSSLIRGPWSGAGSTDVHLSHYPNTITDDEASYPTNHYPIRKRVLISRKRVELYVRCAVRCKMHSSCILVFSQQYLVSQPPCLNFLGFFFDIFPPFPKGLTVLDLLVCFCPGLWVPVNLGRILFVFLGSLTYFNHYVAAYISSKIAVNCNFPLIIT